MHPGAAHALSVLIPLLDFSCNPHYTHPVADVRTRLRVLVASPRDTATERARLPKAIEEIDLTTADAAGAILELVRWETHSWPDFGVDAQDVVNRQVGQADIYIGVIWKRLGTPTGRAESGTVEELELALERKRQGEKRSRTRPF